MEKFLIGEDVVANGEVGYVERYEQFGIRVFRKVRGFSSVFAEENVRRLPCACQRGGESE